MDQINNSVHILIVEDDSFIQELFALELNKHGYQIISCYTIQEASHVLFQMNQTVDFCLLDQDLPDGNGIELISQMKATRPDIPVILMTGKGSPSILEESMLLGAFDYIEKPFSIEKDVLPAIKRVVSTLILKKENSILNEQILHQSKLAALGELSATVVHDVRGPLAMIQVTCEDLRDECAEKNSIDLPTLEQHLAQIHKACDRIKKLVDHLRNYSRNDKDEIEETRLLSSIIEDSLFMVEQKIRKLGVKTSTQIDPALAKSELICFPNKMEQVLTNLMGNACDAMKSVAKKELNVRVKIEFGFLFLSITDTGTGIPEHLKSKIFESFFTTKPKDEGTGLGLSIVRNIVKEHGGELLLESEVGKGTTFTIKLPTSKLIIPAEDNQIINAA